MSYCHVHGIYSDLDDGCPSCREAEERAEAYHAATIEQIAELAWRTRNPGDYECPHCKYIALRRHASRCPLCHGAINPDYWAEIAKREREAAIAAKEQAERRAKLEAEQRQRAEAAARARNKVIAIIALVCIALGGTFLYFVVKSDRTRSPELPSTTQTRISTTMVRGVVRRAKYKVSKDWVILRDGKAVSRSLLFFDRSIPHSVTLSQPSPSGRYLFVDICDEDWCNDQRLIDFKAGQVFSHIDSASNDYIILGMKEGGGSAIDVTSKSWSPTERYVLFGEYIVDLYLMRGSIINSPPFNSPGLGGFSLLKPARWVSESTFETSVEGRRYIVDARSATVQASEPLRGPQLARELVGTWDGKIAGYRSTVTISEAGEGFSVAGSMEKANRPTEDWQITNISGRHLTIYRPDDDAQLSVSLSEHSMPPCLTGQYLEPGSSRPISLCRRSR